MKNIRKIIAFMAVMLLVFSLVSCEYVKNILSTKENSNNNGTVTGDENKSDDENPVTGTVFNKNLSEFYPWLSEIRAEDIAELRIEDNVHGVAPGSLDTVYYFTDSSVILDIFTKLRDMKMRVAVGGEADVAGGRGKRFTFIMGEGEKYNLYISNGFLYTENQTYKLRFVPSIPKEMASEKTRCFVAYSDKFDIYTNTEEPTLVGGSDNFDELEFVVYRGNTDVISAEPIYYMEWSGEKMYIYSDTVFSYTPYGRDEPIYYELCRGMKFSDYIQK